MGCLSSGFQSFSRVALVAFSAVGFSLLPAKSDEVFKVYHVATSTTLTTEGSDGHQLGDFRLVSLSVADVDGNAIGRLDATLLTTAIDTPAPGDEIRVSELVFTLDSGDVVIIGGSGLYPKQAGTFKVGSTLVRPIKGTSGRFAGYTGWGESEHLEDGSWIHSFNFFNTID